jgi:hypothetical protein
MYQFDGRLRQLRLCPRGELRLDDIAGDQDRPHAPPASTADVGGNKPLLGSHQPNDRTMLAMITERADDCLGICPHPRGWK